MTVSIKVNDDGSVQTVYHGQRTGDGWTQLADEDMPTVGEDNVSKSYYWDGETLVVETETIPEGDGLI